MLSSESSRIALLGQVAGPAVAFRLQILLRQVLDVTLIERIGMLGRLLVKSPAMFGAVWHRDAIAVDRLSRGNRRPPDMPFLRIRKEPADKVRTQTTKRMPSLRSFRSCLRTASVVLGSCRIKQVQPHIEAALGQRLANAMRSGAVRIV